MWERKNRKLQLKWTLAPWAVRWALSLHHHHSISASKSYQDHQEALQVETLAFPGLPHQPVTRLKKPLIGADDCQTDHHLVITNFRIMLNNKPKFGKTKIIRKKFDISKLNNLQISFLCTYFLHKHLTTRIWIRKRVHFKTASLTWLNTPTGTSKGDFTSPFDVSVWRQ